MQCSLRRLASQAFDKSPLQSRHFQQRARIPLRLVSLKMTSETGTGRNNEPSSRHQPPNQQLNQQFSIVQQHAKLFNYTPSKASFGGKRKSRGRPQPSVWKKVFVCLAEKDATMVPSPKDNNSLTGRAWRAGNLNTYGQLSKRHAHDSRPRFSPVSPEWLRTVALECHYLVKNNLTLNCKQERHWHLDIEQDGV